jgi:hypothetical protein
MCLKILNFLGRKSVFLPSNLHKSFDKVCSRKYTIVVSRHLQNEFLVCLTANQNGFLRTSWPPKTKKVLLPMFFTNWRKKATFLLDTTNSIINWYVVSSMYYVDMFVKVYIPVLKFHRIYMSLAQIQNWMTFPGESTTLAPSWYFSEVLSLQNKRTYHCTRPLWESRRESSSWYCQVDLYLLGTLHGRTQLRRMKL